MNHMKRRRIEAGLYRNNGGKRREKNVERALIARESEKGQKKLEKQRKWETSTL